MLELQPVTIEDLPLWESLQADPRMMEHLGGAHPKERIAQILSNTLKVVEAGTGWVFKAVVDGHSVGSVCIWESEHDGQPISEIGWMILTAFQKQGLGTQAVRAILDRARAEQRWGVIHAFPAVSNGGSNGICRKLGFELLDVCDIDYAGRMLRCNHWRIDLHA